MTAETPENHLLVSKQGSGSPSPVPLSRGCKATKADGSPCRAQPRPSSGLCFCHDPDCHEQVVAAGRKGAAASRNRRVIAASAQTLTLETAENAAALIASTLDKLLKGEVDRATANGIVYGVQVFLRTIDARDLQRRIEALETAAKARR